MTTVAEAVAELESRRDEGALAGMARYGIKTQKAYGWSVPEVRALAKRIKKELGRDNTARHLFALALWQTGSHEAQLLAPLVDVPALVSEDQMEAWVADLDSWDTCDQLCNNLLGAVPLAWDKALDWSAREEEFVKRAGFALMAVLAWHEKDAPDERFLPMLQAIEREASDDRNFVKKAVNWALRHIGKRNAALNARAVETARRIAAAGTRAGRWVASDALRELESEKARTKLGL
jgi:3-methyladenine DNA glycosylase AlkD